jgi:hypothetical protein
VDRKVKKLRLGTLFSGLETPGIALGRALVPGRAKIEVLLICDKEKAYVRMYESKYPRAQLENDVESMKKNLPKVDILVWGDTFMLRHGMVNVIGSPLLIYLRQDEDYVGSVATVACCS